MSTSEKDQEIQQAVNERYGGVAERVLAASEAKANAAKSAGFTIEFLESASQTASCCGPEDATCGCGPEAIDGTHEHDPVERPETIGIGSKLYEQGQVDSLPEEAVLASLGCGNPVAIAERKSVV